jgi:transposase
VDKNIVFSQEMEKEASMIYFHATLDYPAPFCPHCGAQTAKYDFQRPSKITYLKMFERDSVIWLKKRRFKCKDCGRVSVAESIFAPKNGSISRHTKISCVLKLKEKFTRKDIGKLLGISSSSVLRILKDCFPDVIQRFVSLPSTLSFDEFTFQKDQMAFIMIDPKTNAVLDILENRLTKDLMIYFNKFPKEVRERVQAITCDMYQPYLDLIKKLFPNAKIIIDRFHIVQHISRAFMKTRIKVQNQFSRDSQEYKNLKSYWRVLQKFQLDLSIFPHYQKPFKDNLTSREIKDRLLHYDGELTKAYSMYQDFLFAFKAKDELRLFDIIEKYKDTSNPYFHPVFQTFLKLRPYLLNALKSPLSNARMECMNNQIKVFKHLSFGFRNFQNFKLRFLVLRKQILPLKI